MCVEHINGYQKGVSSYSKFNCTNPLASGGGHGEIGYHLALKLAKEKGLQVTMIQDSACKTDKPPFDSYGDLAQAGVDVKVADLSNGGGLF